MSLLLLGLLPILFLALLISVATRKLQWNLESHPIVFPERTVLAVALAILGLNTFAYESDGGLGMGLFVISLVVVILATMERRQRTPLVYFLALLGSVAGLFFAWRANEFVQSLNVVVALLSLLALLILRSAESIHWEGAWIFRSAWSFFLHHFFHLPGFLRTFFRKSSSGTSLVTTVRTIIITLVVVLFFAILLSSADPIFDKIIAEFREELGGRGLLSLLLAAALGLTLTVRLVAKDHGPVRFTILGFHEVITPIAGMILLFGIFLFVQAKYLFGSHENIQLYNLTYSEYVRKGFIELLVATFFGSLIAYLVILKQHALTERPRINALKAVNVVLLLELGFLLVSALKRDWLYMDAYGLTRVRMIGETFLVWLAGILLLLLVLNLWKAVRERHFLGGILLLSSAIFVWLNVVNIDRTIALATPPRNQPYDMFYVSLLSPDAIDGWERAIREASATLDSTLEKDGALTADEKMRLSDAKIAMYALDRKHDDLLGWRRLQQEGFDVEEPDWQDFNRSVWEARNRMLADKHLFEDAVRCIMGEIEDYQLEHNMNLDEQHIARFNNYEYPFTSLEPRQVEWSIPSFDSLKANQQHTMEMNASDGLVPADFVATSCSHLLEPTTSRPAGG